MVHAWDRDIDGAEGLYKKAVESDPQDANALSLVAVARLARTLPADTVLRRRSLVYYSIVITVTYYYYYCRII